MHKLFGFISDDGKLLLTVVASAACGVVMGWYLNSAGKIDSKKGTDEALTKDVASDDEIDLTDSPELNANGNFKMVLVVRQDLKMGKGKVAAQCCHAAVGAYKQLQSKNPHLLRFWEYNGQPKVVVKCNDEMELIALHQHAKALGVTATIIQDAGRTQIKAGSRTVLGVGPADEEIVNKITGHLKLL